ncbi:hypothetical protein KIH86_02915 [Paenibacillus sp. HN-1]|uniref:hypothetical protein n=1 Tax=Paenibacillus TaxID=44249 RepID=UPI001CA7CD20|nr:MULTISPECIES: hypothetical protein [Paenibacillus]MBY9080971.1 hypothetical protein [Paenibacillus sp. CGMCC 1.18879]MBY9083183.1 hypothetical protein [Paenibacillus sinensis]
MEKDFEGLKEVKAKASNELTKALREIDAGKNPVEALKEMVDKKRFSAREASYKEGMRDENY